MTKRVSRLEGMVTAIIYALSTVGALVGVGFFFFGHRISHIWQHSAQTSHELQAHKQEGVDRDGWGRLSLVESQQDVHGRTLEKISDNLTSIKLDFNEVVPVVRKLSEKDMFITWLFRGLLGLVGLVGVAGVFAIIRAIDTLYGGR